MSKDYYIVHKSLLGERLLQVSKMQDYLIKHPDISIQKACKDFNISRSTYYKYKDKIFLLNENKDSKALISLTLKNEKGILSYALNLISNSNINILTISQATPINDIANVIISMDISDIKNDIEEVIKGLNSEEKIIRAELISIE